MIYLALSLGVLNLGLFAWAVYAHGALRYSLIRSLTPSKVLKAQDERNTQALMSVMRGQWLRVGLPASELPGPETH